MSKISFAISPTLSAFEDRAIGSRVTNKQGLLDALMVAVQAHDPAKDRAPGQHFIVLPESAFSTVSGGVGLRTTNQEDYVVRVHRGHVSANLRREKALPVEGLAVIVYTAEAWLTDGDVINDKLESVADGHSHIIVAVLASAGPQGPADVRRLVLGRNGGNNEYMSYSPAEFEKKLVDSVAYWDQYAVVAD